MANYGASKQFTRSMSRTGSVHEAAELGNVSALEAFVRKGIDNGYPNRVTLQIRDDLMGAMPLHFAAEKGHMQVVAYLVNQQVDLDAGDNNLVTAMHLASIENHTDIIKFLLENGAQGNLPDRDGDTPLHWAATKGHTETMELLLNYKSLDQVNNAGWTPLHRAAFNGRIDACDLLLKRGASLLYVNNNGDSALHLACAANRMSAVEYLLSWEPNIEMENKDGKRAYELTAPQYQGVVENLAASREAVKREPVTGRFVTRKDKVRTSIAPERSPEGSPPSGSRRSSEPLGTASPRRQASPALPTLVTHKSFGLKDDQGFPMVLDAPNELNIRQPTPPDDFISYVEASRRSSYSSYRTSSPHIVEGGEDLRVHGIKESEGTSPELQDDMSPWDSEEDKEGVEYASGTIEESQGKKMRHSDGLLVSSKKRNSLNKKFLKKYSLQKHHLFAP